VEILTGKLSKLVHIFPQIMKVSHALIFGESKPYNVGENGHRSLQATGVSSGTKHGFFYNSESLGAFTNLWKASISFVMSIRPSVRVEHIGFHTVGIRKVLYWRF
jgi:hypothetical protein